MKKIFVGAAMFAALAAAAPNAQAQQRDGNLTFGVSGGLNVPIGSLGDTQGSGFGLMGHATLRPGSSPFSFRGDVGFLTNPGKTVTPITGGPSLSTKGLTWTTVNANILYDFQQERDATFVPYVIGGVGFYNGTQNVGTNFGINAGGGVTFKLSGFDAFTEARLTNVFTDNRSSRMIPITFGINLNR